LVIVIGGYFLLNQDSREATSPAGGQADSLTQKNVDGSTIEEEGTMADNTDHGGDAMVEGDKVMEDKVSRTGTYEAYDSSKLALASDGDVVLFFHAGWCPTCKVADKDINANLTSIPANTHILKTDYDTQTALKKKYGVTYQHTFVQVDAQGNQIKKWGGSNTLNSILSQIQ
jgi:hypothetical protein